MARRKRRKLRAEGEMCRESTESLITACWVPHRIVTKFRMKRETAGCEVGGGGGGGEGGVGEGIRGVVVVGGGV